MDQPIMSVPAARAYLGGIGKTRLFELIADKSLAKVKIGRRTFVTTESVEKFIEKSVVHND